LPSKTIVGVSSEVRTGGNAGLCWQSLRGFSVMISEREMEDQIAADPERFLHEPDLVLVARQFSIGAYRFDLLFEDRHGGKLIVEIQKGTLDRNHAYKILDYYDELLELQPNDFIDVMVVANQITAERKKRLHDRGIAYREIPVSWFSVSNSPSEPNGSSLPQTPHNILETRVMNSTGVANGLNRETRKPSGGPSAFLRAARLAIQATQESTHWKLSNSDGCLQAIHLAVTSIMKRTNNLGFVAKLWMERPEKGFGMCKFEVVKGKKQDISSRERIVDSIRRHLKKYAN
jgi:hypothetical protein